MNTPAESLDRWRQMRFGMFIHWGPVSLKGTEIGWSRGAQVPQEEYDQLYKQFNPTLFNADEWVSLAKAAGMKYLVITSKHHDGFCLWDSKYTDYNIMATPFGRDVLAELSEACRRQDVMFCVYYSILDWWHPDYPMGSPGGRTEKPNPNMPRYFEYVKNQTREIIERYGPLGVLWFDGGWEKPWTPDYARELYRYLREIQPDLLINNRIGGGYGDFVTPEQKVGEFNRERPWETCMTLGRQWSWKPNDEIKTLEQCIRTLLHVTGGDGNFLFNVGPMPDGRIEPRQARRLEEMGDWLKRYGDGVYGTRGGPFKPGGWGASTCRDDRIYLFIMGWPDEGPLHLPPIDRRIISIRTRTAGEADVQQTDEGITVQMAEADRDPIVTVIELVIDGEAFEIEPV